jgi:transposase
MTVYVMKARLKELWEPGVGRQWHRAWRARLRQAYESGIEPLKQCAAKPAPYWKGIVARMRWPMLTGQLEGINNRIKVMKCMAYG